MNNLNIAVFLLLMVTVCSVLASDQAQVPELQACGLNSQATELAQLIKQHPSQKRPLLQCNELLSSIAQQRAEQLANNNADSGISANQVLINGGFRVPNYYPIIGNQVESVAKNLDQASAVFEQLLSTSKYHDHVMGVGEFYGLQSELGVGFFKAKDITQNDQWVVMAAAPWEPPKVVIKQNKQNLTQPYKIAKGCDTDWKNSNDEMLKSKCGSLRGGRSKVN